MHGQYRKDIHPGLEVAIIFTSAAFHSRGIKVRLQDGQIGRIAEIS